MRYRAETTSGGTSADVIDTEAKPMRQVIARCDTAGNARRIAAALNSEGAAAPLRERMKTLYADLCAPGPMDANRQRTLATLAEQALDS